MNSFVIDENAIFQRLCILLSQVGIDTDDKVEKAKIRAYVEGLKTVGVNLSRLVSNSALNIFSHPLTSELEKAFENEQFEQDGLNFSFTDYSVDKIGALTYAWLTALHTVDLGANGVSWEYIDERKMSFSDIENAKYRWDMIESR